MTVALDEAIDTWHAHYVDGGLLPCALTLVAREGDVLALRHAGMADVERGIPCREDSIFRIFSMTKPVTTVAAMSMVDDGLIRLDDPVSGYIPSFAMLSVNASDDPLRLEPRPARVPMTIRHLLTHTSGLTYGGEATAVPALYDRESTNFGTDDGPLEEVVDRLAGIPLLFEPGQRWHYSVSLDVLGRVLEVVDAEPLDRVLAHRVLEPVGMVDTSFAAVPDDQARTAALYQAAGEGYLRIPDGSGFPGASAVTTLSGGAGLLSTAHDYARFVTMLLQGGEIEGARVISTESAAQMQRNQLPGDIASCGEPTFSESTTRGVGFGLGGSVVVDPSVTEWPSSLGEYAWGGYASTAFLVDPVRRCTAIFLTQLIPSSRYPGLRRGLREIVARFVPSADRR